MNKKVVLQHWLFKILHESWLWNNKGTVAGRDGLWPSHYSAKISWTIHLGSDLDDKITAPPGLSCFF